MSGTVNISRGLWDDQAFKPEPFTEREAWVWMIMEASYKARSKPVGNIWVDLERGQLACSVRFMCDAWQWSKSRVDRFLKRLENRDMIGTDSGTGVNVITICKYDEYQNKPSSGGTAENEKRDSSGTAAGQQRDKPNKGLIPDAIQGKEKNNAQPDGFAAFWEIWPAKLSKQNAQKAWRKLSVENRRVAYAAVRDGWFERWRQHHPDANPIHPATFLNGQRWADEFQPKFTAIDGGQNDRLNANPKRTDPALEQIARLTGIAAAPGHGGGRA